MKSYTRSSTPPPPDMSSYAPQAANYNKERLNSPETLAEWTCLYRMIYICTMDPYGPPPPPYPQIGGGGRGDRAPSPLKIYKLPKIYLYVGKTCIYSHLFGEEGGGNKILDKQFQPPPPLEMFCYALQLVDFEKARPNSFETIVEWTCLYRMISNSKNLFYIAIIYYHVRYFTTYHFITTR